MILVALTLAGLAVLVAAHGHASAAPVCTINWTGGAGDLQWQTADNWDLAHVPAAADYACVPAASTDQITFTGTASVKGVSALGAKFTNNGNLSLTDPAQPSNIRNLRAALNKVSIAPGATLTLPGHPVLAGGSLGGGGTMTMPAGSNLAILAHTAIRDGTTLNLNGPTSWSAGNICIGEGTVVNNRSTFTVSAINNGTNNNGVLNDCVGEANNRLNNLAGGTFRRTGAAGAPAVMDAPFNNSGAVTVGPGDLLLRTASAGAADTGSFAIAADTTLVLNAPRQFGPAATVIGDGALRVNADVVFAGQSIPHLWFTGGTSTGAVTFAGDGSWNGGRFDGNTTVTIAAAANVTVDGDVSLHNGRTLANNGTINWDAGNVCLGEASQLNNAGTFDAVIDAGSLADCDAIPANNRVHNMAAGLLVHDGIGLLTVVPPFDNEGTVHVVTGSMTVGPNSTSFTDTGDVTLDAATKLTVTAGTAGRRFAAGADILTNGAGSLAAVSGNITFNGQTIGHLAITSGAVSGPFTVSTDLLWSGGRLDGATTTTIGPSATATITRTVSIRTNKTLQNNGTLLWNGGDICLAQGSHVVNAKQFTVNANGAKMYICASGAISDVVNKAGATLSRLGTIGQLTSIGEPVDNQGTIDVARGNLAIGPNNSGVADTGTAKLGNSVSPNATLELASGAQRTYASGASFSGPGVLKVSMPGLVTMNGQSIGRVAIENSTVSGAFTPTKSLSLKNAFLTGASTTTIPSGSVATINGPLSVSGGKQLVNNGSIVWNTGNICMGGGSGITNNTANFTAYGDGAAIQNCFGGAASVTNANSGWLTVTSPSAITIGVPFTNNGLLRIVAGTLFVTGNYAPGPNSGLRVTIAGNEPGAQFGQLHVTGTMTIAGFLTIDADPGFSPDLNDTFAVAVSDGASSGTFSSTSQSPLSTPNEMGYAITYPAQTVLATAKRAADLSVSITAPSSVTVGSDITYSDFVYNDGPNATTVTLTHTIASNMTFVSAPAGCTSTATLVTCSLGTMASKASKTIAIVLHPMFVAGYNTTAKVTGAGTVDVTPAGATATKHVEVT